MITHLRNQLLLGLAATAFGLTLLLTMLHWNGLWLDELYTLHAINLPVKVLLSERTHRGHTPLYFLLLKGCLWITRASASETSLRALSLAWWVASVASFWLLVRRFLPAAAGMACCFFALNGIALRYGIEARMYTMVLFIAVWALRSYLELVQSPSRRWYLVFIAAVFAGLWTSPSVALILAGFLFDAWRRRSQDPVLFRRISVVIALGLLSIAPGMLLYLLTRDRNAIASMGGTRAISHLIALFSGVFAQDDHFATDRPLRVVQVLGAFLCICIFVSLWQVRRERDAAVQLCLRLVAAPMLIAVLTWMGAEILVLVAGSEAPDFSVLGPARYYIGALPAAAFLAGGSMARLAVHWRRSYQIAAAAALLALLCISGFFTLRSESDPFRFFVQWLGARYDKHDAIVVVPHEIADAIPLYLPGAHVNVAVNRWIVDEPTLRAQLAPLNRAWTTWLFWYRGRSSPVVDVATSMWGPYVSSSDKNTLGSIRVLRFNPRRNAPRKPS